MITNKLTFDPDPFTRTDPKFNHGHSTTSLKISCKSVQPFSRNVADKETKKERKKSPENNTPSPYRGRGKNSFFTSLMALLIYWHNIYHPNFIFMLHGPVRHTGPTQDMSIPLVSMHGMHHAPLDTIRRHCRVFMRF